MTNTFYLPTKFIFGPDSISRLGLESKKLGKKALLVSSTDILQRTGIQDRIFGDLRQNDVEAIMFDRVVPNARSSIIDRGARIARKEGIDLVIGFGGGSAMDTAKGIAIASSGSKSIWSYVTNETDITSPVSPIVQIPTIAGSGSEANGTAVITNRKTREKLGLFSAHCFAKVSIIDPKLTLSVPEKQTAQGGVDIFCHLVESYITTNRPSPLTDGILETVMKIVVQYLPRVLVKPDDIEARTQLSWASTVATSQLSTIGGGAGIMTLHDIEHVLSANYDIVHGDGMAALLPAWLEFTFPAVKDRFIHLGNTVFGEEDLITAVANWLEQIGMKLRLRNLGVELDRIDTLASEALRTASFIKYHPVLLDTTAITHILKDSY